MLHQPVSDVYNIMIYMLVYEICQYSEEKSSMRAETCRKNVIFSNLSKRRRQINLCLLDGAPVFSPCMPASNNSRVVKDVAIGQKKLD